MTRKKWHHDGPVVATMLHHSYVMLNTVLKMSAEAGRARAEVTALRDFLKMHPEHLPNKYDIQHAPEKTLARVIDLMKRHEQEHQRRIQALLKRTTGKRKKG
jgi:hypothetical protein